MSNNLQIQSLVLARVRGIILLAFKNKLQNVPFLYNYFKLQYINYIVVHISQDY